jgi:arginine decarboxylase
LNETFKNLIEQTYTFPQPNFEVNAQNNLLFNGLDLKTLIDTHGSPLKLTYLPKIGEQIRRARGFFQQAMHQHHYDKPYIYTYCTKSSHFMHVIDQVLANNAHLELSSAFDTEIILTLHAQNRLRKDMYILCNGYKTPDYLAGIERIMLAGFTNVIPILDATAELRAYERFRVPHIQIGLRMATDEDPTFDLYTSRFGIRLSELMDFYLTRLHNHPKIELKMLHFFVYSGIRDSDYYWTELERYVKMYADIKKICPSLDAINMGGGMPIQNSLSFDYDYQSMCNRMIGNIKAQCEAEDVETPAIFSEFGTYTVGESGAVIFKIMGSKRQNDRETWYIVDNSLITTLPDMWADKQKFILLPINKWDEEYQRVILGGLTCDNDDFCNVLSDHEELFLPIVEPHNDEHDDEEPLYVGFFHTGAYQESLGGFGGINHCLIPTPKHILVDKNEAGEFSYRILSQQQPVQQVLQLLGYNQPYPPTLPLAATANQAPKANTAS